MSNDDSRAPIAIHVVILTLNESIHIARCIESCKNQVESVTVIDSGSTDGTIEIAEKLGAEVISHPWKNYATQLNFGLSALVTRGGWLMRIDADEVLDPATPCSLSETVSQVGDDCDGILVQRRIYFLGRRIRYGAIEPSWQLRLWRNGRGRCEQRWMDEHVIVSGNVQKSGVIISDINLNSLTWWTAKHNQYASREAIDLLNARFKFLRIDKLPASGSSPQARARRFLKEKVYLRTPAGVRTIAYFLYRYFVRLGFLDGRPGFYFHVLQGLWYRGLVDAKIFEIEELAKQKGVPIAKAIKDRTGFVVDEN
ncbi:glycosyltransferase family 2 protein [Mesorhizobium temperatum]|uniref:glycosyltransferase family 2 protein n=1 Tax=Mesorhizobium temperatum TaxID=241416 RepID=UPI00197E68DE|nr:glycosyltransferase family 2 protein [Mesorhizobium temperatum]